MVMFKYIFVILFLFSVVQGRRRNKEIRHRHSQYIGGHCESLVEPFCQDLSVFSHGDYSQNHVYMPNLLGHTSQAEASQNAEMFYPFIKTRCSPYLKAFTCSVYLPTCLRGRDGYREPCRSLCQRTKDDCNTFMESVDFVWPGSLDCNRFLENGNCISIEDIDHDLDENPQADRQLLSPESPEGHCEDLTIPACVNLPFYKNGLRMPNRLGHIGQDVAGLEMHQFVPLIKVRCSPYIAHFICYIYAPPCLRHGSGYREPCRSLCQQAQDGCLGIMQKFGFSWPANLDCDQFQENEQCISADNIDNANYEHNGNRDPGTREKSDNPKDATPVEDTSKEKDTSRKRNDVYIDWLRSGIRVNDAQVLLLKEKVEIAKMEREKMSGKGKRKGKGKKKRVNVVEDEE